MPNNDKQALATSSFLFVPRPLLPPERLTVVTSHNDLLGLTPNHKAWEANHVNLL